MMQFTLDHLYTTRDELQELIIQTEYDIVMRARTMLIEGNVVYPNQKQLEDIALILSGVDKANYNTYRKLLESKITFQMEEGVSIS